MRLFCTKSTGANAPTTAARFPRGEAIHYRQIAMDLGVPPEAILVETKATNTRENIQFTRQLFQDRNIRPSSVLLISRPYQQRRAYATFRQLWPDAQAVCASQPIALSDYIASIGDANFVVNMIVGDTLRVIEYPKLESAMEQPIPARVNQALERLIRAGFTSRRLRS